MSRKVTLRSLAPKISVGYKILEDCLKAGVYEGLPITVRSRSTTAGRAGLVGRAWIAPEAVPALLERTWEWVLYERGCANNMGQGGNSGPWVPAAPLKKWLQRQAAKRAGAAYAGPNPAVMTSLANDLNIDPRRLYAWVNGEYEHIPYAVLEDALWAYACMTPEDICPRELMVISKIPKNRKRRKKT